MVKLKRFRRVCPVFLLAVSLILPLPVFSQEAADGNADGNADGSADGSGGGAFPPESLRRPLRGEAPRYPKDMIIGELGRGNASEEAWLYARNFITALLQGSLLPESAGNAVFADVDASLLARVSEKIEEAEAGRFHLGGGRQEEDGAVSFLVRFLGREMSMTGELYLTAQENEDGSSAWHVEDFALEEIRDLAEEREAYRYDFSPYERFY